MEKSKPRHIPRRTRCLSRCEIPLRSPTPSQFKVLERPRIDLVDHSPLPPRRLSHGHSSFCAVGAPSGFAARALVPVQNGVAWGELLADPMHRTRAAGSAPMLRRALRRFGFGVSNSGSSSLAGGGAAAARSRSSASCSAQMIAERSDRAPEVELFNVAISARRSSFSPSKASTISASAAGSSGRSSGKSPCRRAIRKRPESPAKQGNSRNFRRPLRYLRDHPRPLRETLDQHRQLRSRHTASAE